MFLQRALKSRRSIGGGGDNVSKQQQAQPQQQQLHSIPPPKDNRIETKKDENNGATKVPVVVQEVTNNIKNAIPLYHFNKSPFKQTIGQKNETSKTKKQFRLPSNIFKSKSKIVLPSSEQNRQTPKQQQYQQQQQPQLPQQQELLPKLASLSIPSTISAHIVLSETFSSTSTTSSFTEDEEKKHDNDNNNDNRPIELQENNNINNNGILSAIPLSSPIQQVEYCLQLLESPSYEHNRYGIEKLISITNSDFVNSKPNNSIAHALICNNNYIQSSSYFVDDGQAQEQQQEPLWNAERLRTVFLSYFCSDNNLVEIDHYNDNDINNYDDGDDISDCHSELEESNGRHMGDLKRPALRVLVSSLELIVSLEQQKKHQQQQQQQLVLRDKQITTDNNNNNKSIINLNCTFWKKIINSLSEIIQVSNLRPLETALSMKCFYLLGQLEPRIIYQYINYSLYPYLYHIHDTYDSTSTNNQNSSSNAYSKMLRREVTKVLNQIKLQQQNNTTSLILANTTTATTTATTTSIAVY